MRDIRPSEGAPAGERSIRNISVAPRRHHSRPEVIADHSDMPDLPPELPRRRSRRRNKTFWLAAAAVVVVCALLGTLLSTVFAGATVTAYQRTEEVALPSVLAAAPNAPVGTLAYKTISVTRSQSATVPAQGTKRVSRPASGSITISNSYSGSSERLIANTRFKAPDGKIYKIRESITVPGATGSGASLKPGTLSVTVYAESPGTDYNKSGPVNLVIAAFVEGNNPRADKITAVAQNGFTGGFVGDEPAVSSADLASAEATLKQKADAEARAAAAAEIPEGYVAVPGSLGVAFAELSQSAEGKNAVLTQSATASGIIIRRADLASAIARESVKTYNGEPVDFLNAESMDMSLGTTTARSDGAITLSLKGSAKLVWTFDQNALKEALLGKDKALVDDAIRAFEPAITRAEVTIRPFWQGKLPSNPDKIKVNTKVE